MSVSGGFPSPVVKAKVAHWSAGIKQGMMALPPPWFSLGAVSFDPLEKGETFPASVYGGRTQNLKKKPLYGPLPD